MAKQYDFLFRLLMLGDSGVGKTCMLRRFTESDFDSSHISTIGIDFKMKTLEVDGTKVRVQIWDTAGQERYQTITKQYYRRAQGIIFVYDIADKQSFKHIGKWVSDVDECIAQKVETILVGNKCDDAVRRQVTKKQGTKLAESYGMPFFETSASANINVNEAFIRLTELVLQAHQRDVDNLLGSLDSYLDKAGLEEEKESKDTNCSQKTCSC
ncbi:ras-related protein Rab-15-like [Archocentrus centrarchus]|uniref:ras-related protein Rab-15-like n=1 Tax=Archocentrus centrarchus TaxID=63155 RepID=UPI0011EA1DAE|nr:ras-related protein Rab-15-like [Archocentrus centrarchus]